MCFFWVTNAWFLSQSASAEAAEKFRASSRRTQSPECDMEANETNDKEVENNAVRPKSDLDADEKTDKEIEIENDAVRPK